MLRIGLLIGELQIRDDVNAAALVTSTYLLQTYSKPGIVLSCASSVVRKLARNSSKASHDRSTCTGVTRINARGRGINDRPPHRRLPNRTYDHPPRKLPRDRLTPGPSTSDFRRAACTMAARWASSWQSICLWRANDFIIGSDVPKTKRYVGDKMGDSDD
jgi:hypothetical protein